MVASWISNPSAKCLCITGVSPALDCATKYWNLERYICLESVILSSGDLFQVFEFIPGRLICVIWVEHVGEHFLYMIEVFVQCFDIRISEDTQPGV